MTTPKKKSGPEPRRNRLVEPRGPLPSKSLDVAPDQETWTRVQLNALRRLGFDAPPRDMDLLFHISQRSGLDPFQGHLYMAQNARGEWEVRTKISGLLAGARAATAASGESLAVSAPEWADRDGQWREVWSEEYPPTAARVTVRRAGHPFTSVALFRESAVYNDEGRLNRTWRQRPASQLAKVAKAAALRDACPAELSGLYTDDEQLHHDTIPGTVVSAADGPGEQFDSELDALLAEDKS